MEGSLRQRRHQKVLTATQRVCESATHKMCAGKGQTNNLNIYVSIHLMFLIYSKMRIYKQL